MKLQQIKLFNSIQVRLEKTFFTDREYDIELNDSIIRITELKTGDTSFTTLFNTCYWRVNDEPTTSIPTSSRSSKKSKPAD